MATRRFASGEPGDGAVNDDLIRQLSELMDTLRAEADEMARTAPGNRRDKMRYASMFARTSQRLRMLEELRTSYAVSSTRARPKPVFATGD